VGWARAAVNRATLDAAAIAWVCVVEDLLASLYGLYTLLRLHFLQEEENYFTLAEDEAQSSR
jgi:hypothetical protein